MKTMDWKCLDCRALFQGPCDRAPENGCAKCGSRNVIDINVEPVTAEETAEILREGRLYAKSSLFVVGKKP